MTPGEWLDDVEACRFCSLGERGPLLFRRHADAKKEIAETVDRPGSPI